MSISKVCRELTTFWRLFPDGLKDSGEYKINTGSFKKYCPEQKCNSDIEKINAGCLRLIYDFFIKSGFSADPDTLKNDAVCIIIWLGYILSLKPPNDINTINDFYYSHIENNEEYSNHKNVDTTYTDYKKIIDETKEYMDINISNMSKFYQLLKLLCNMYTAYAAGKSTDVSQYANNFFDEYKKLFDDDNNNNGNSYNKILNVLSNYYNNIETGIRFNNTPITRPKLPTEKAPKKDNVEGIKVTKETETSGETDKLDTETPTPSSNITLSESPLVNKLVIVLPILAAIPFFLGIAYKYSLFGFRKRSKKHLREKLNK
ncbi:PIR protein [Plasmodium yoelii]|uniref:PIR protein n=2 Tax=Plasmodium yoelii TaxID=5861 RepID=A0AAF0AZS4_PLAYO|nr:PIR protein [Plasmodium yoelii]WBY54583.1 PIR protein [Plasmodium yoelii yoelii]CDU15982.1 YIR protein [Plasmodium yoelii]VTZ71577.1 PIR protein [Plasmodium yoelii]|eukprot:XP_022811284.1 PIR protein [Plasmodium yoelii]